MQLFRAIVITIIAMSPATISAQEKFEIPEELKASYNLINRRSVEGAVTFLASDAMRGRQTPSRELDIASAYVAARFKAAGLEGLGDKGGFLQTTNVATSSVPTGGIEFSVDGKAVNHFGLLSAGDSFEYEGEILVLTGDEPRDQQFDGPITFVVAPFEGPRDSSNFNRKMVQYRRRGATAILVQVATDHALTGAAKRATNPRIVSRRGGASGPVLLVPEMDLKGKKLEMNLPAQIGGKAPVSNVIGVLRGSDPELSKEAIVITAHLDHIGEQGVMGDTISNGADDNATGSTAIVTLADAYGAMKTPPKRSVIFMTFWGEEKGFLGSYHYVKNPTWPLAKTVCNINIEMIGRPEPGANEKVWVTGWDKSDLGKLMNEGSESVGVLTFEHPELSRGGLFRASDNYPFFEKGIVAHSFSAGSLHEDYHQVTDHVEKLELRHMTRVIQGLFAGSLNIANGATPEMTGRQ